jgi:RHS repeat-associated protein
LTRLADGQVWHYVTDHLGTPQEMYDQDGEIVWAADFSAYGLTARSLALEVDNPIRFPGQYYDQESGLHYNRFRYYDPQVGRYVNQDPIGLRGGWNQYAYVRNPTGWIDPRGLAGKIPKNFGKNKPTGPIPLPEAPDHPLDMAYDAVSPNQKIWEGLSPHDYTQYCRKWVKANKVCTANDREPGMDVKTPSDYFPEKIRRAIDLPRGYTCADPYYFPELIERGAAATADMADALEMMGRVLKSKNRGRK